MKKFLSICLFSLFFFPATAQANKTDCPDLETAVEATIADREEDIDTLIDSITDAEEYSDKLSDCLDVVFDMGNIFNFGLNLPSIDDIISKVCSEISSQIQEKLDGITGSIQDKITEQSSKLHGIVEVNGNSSEISNGILGNLPK